MFSFLGKQVKTISQGTEEQGSNKTVMELRLKRQDLSLASVSVGDYQGVLKFSHQCSLSV